MAASIKPLIFVIGPTGVGKSKFALDLAQKEKCMLLNADSVQIYSGAIIGANAPTLEDFTLVQHKLYGFIQPNENFTAGDYLRNALAALSEIQNEIPILVGGSGFYIQALEKGMYEPHKISEAIKFQVENLHNQGGNALLLEKLKELDSESSVKIHISDTYRLTRALSFVLSSGKAWSKVKADFQKNSPSPLSAYKIIKIGLSMQRDQLRQMLQIRTKSMLARGLVDETRKFIDNYGKTCKILGSVGYKECVSYLAGELPHADLEEQIVKSTMALAKRQMTWFRRDSEIKWYDVHQEWQSALDFMFDQIHSVKNNG